MQSPGPEVSKDLAAFSGRWIGVWTDGKSYRKNMALIIEQVTARDVMDTSRVIATREAIEKLQESLS